MTMKVTSPTVHQPAAPTDLPPRVRGLILLRDQGLLALWLVLVLAFSFWAAPHFFTVSTGLSVLNSASLTAIFSAGLGVGVMTGVLDLSIPGTAALAGVITGLALEHGLPVGLAIVAGIVVGAVVGALNGLIAIRGLDPLIVTIGMLAVTSGLALVFAGGYDIAGLEQLTFIGTQQYLGIPAPVIVTVVLFAVLTVFLRYTRGGMRLLAVGGNAEGARRAGIATDRYRVIGFTISGLCAAVGGIVSAAYVNTASPTASVGTIFDALTAVALAGVSFGGGRGSLPRVLLGAIVLATISAGLLLANVQTYWSSVATGVLLIGGLALNRWTTRTASQLLVTSHSSAAEGARQR
jgi:ribose transport system permease protein